MAEFVLGFLVLKLEGIVSGSAVSLVPRPYLRLEIPFLFLFLLYTLYYVYILVANCKLADEACQHVYAVVHYSRCAIFRIGR